MKPLLQELLARQALNELHIEFDDLHINHLDGYNIVDGRQFNVLYPHTWVGKSIQCRQEKELRFAFVGLIGDDRQSVLSAFTPRADSFIHETRLQRVPRLKGRFRRSYWRVLHKAEFTLCPQRRDWPGNPTRAWTYRFIEACLSFSIPVTFAELPLGDDFMRGFHTIDSEEANTAVWTPEAAAHNFTLALRRHVLPEQLLAMTSKPLANRH